MSEYTLDISPVLVLGTGGGPGVNVANYASGDGTTDDTAAIDAAIAATPAGGVLSFPGGKRFKTGGGHLIDKQMTIVGPGTHDQFYSDGQLYLANGANSDMFTLAAPNITIRDLSIYGNSPHQSATSRGIVTSPTVAPNYFNLDNLRVVAFCGDGVMAQTSNINSLSGRITGLRSIGNTGYGLHVTCSDTLVSDSYIHQNVQSGIYCSGSALTIHGGHIWGNGTGSTGYLDGVTLVSSAAVAMLGTYIESNTNGRGVYAATGGNTGHQFVGCDFWNNGYNGIYLYQANHCVIQGSKFRRNNYKTAAGTGGAGVLMDACTACATTGNVMWRESSGGQTYGYYELNTNAGNTFVGNVSRAADHVTGSYVLHASTVDLGNVA